MWNIFCELFASACHNLLICITNTIPLPYQYTHPRLSKTVLYTSAHANPCPARLFKSLVKIFFRFFLWAFSWWYFYGTYICKHVQPIYLSNKLMKTCLEIVFWWNWTRMLFRMSTNGVYNVTAIIIKKTFHELNMLRRIIFTLILHDHTFVWRKTYIFQPLLVNGSLISYMSVQSIILFNKSWSVLDQNLKSTLYYVSLRSKHKIFFCDHFC